MARSSQQASDLLSNAYAGEINWQPAAEMFAAAKRTGCVSFVYFIQEQQEDEEEVGPLKIGTALNPIKRLRALQTGNPRRLWIERLLIGDRKLERFLHESFQAYAITDGRNRSSVYNAVYQMETEWFKADTTDWLLGVAERMAALQLTSIESIPENRTVQGIGQVASEMLKSFPKRGHDDLVLLAVGAGSVRRRLR